MARQDLSKIAKAKVPQPTPSTDEPAAIESANTSIQTPAAAPVEAPGSGTAPRAPRTTNAAPRPGQPAAETASVGVPFHLPDSLDKRLAAYMKKTGKSHHRILLEAVARTYPQLPDLVRKAMAGEDVDEPELDDVTALFDLPDWSAPRTSQEPRVKHTVRVSPTNRKRLEDIRREVGAPSRNLLIVTAYNEFLPSTNES